MPVQRAKNKPKTPFGISVEVYTALTGDTKMELAAKAGVSYPTMIEAASGRSAGYEIIPIVRKEMIKQCPKMRRYIEIIDAVERPEVFDGVLECGQRITT